MTQQFDRDIEILLREKYQGLETEDFLRDVTRLKEGEPLDYIIGHIPFLNCHIDLSLKPLIPRTETEFWVERALKEKLDETKGIHILDLFAGSGCIGTAILKALPHATVDFGEIDPTLTEQIHINLKHNNVEERAQVVQTDIFSNVPKKTYDYIFTNPPYLSKDRLKDVQDSVLSNEPHEALFAKDDGLYYIKTLIENASAYLKPDGLLFIEIDPHQKDSVNEYADSLECDVDFWEDQYKNIRVALVSYNLS
jgi:release factor glutamine methyltransferase